jgi:nicotinamide-nucleotide adenylyltransferase
MKTALFVGRFQPFHLGHLSVIEDILKKNDRLIILIGSAHQKDTPENPFSVEERIEMIRNAMEAKGYTDYEITSLQDFHDDRLWTEAVMKAYDFDVVYSRNEWTVRCFRKFGKNVREHKLYNGSKYSGTEIRKRLAAGKGWKDLVPVEVYGVIMKARSTERLRKISKKETE